MTVRVWAARAAAQGVTVARWVFGLVSGIDPRDVFLLGGLLLLWWGLFQIWKPLSFIVIGAVLVKLAVWTPAPASTPQEKPQRHGSR